MISFKTTLQRFGLSKIVIYVCFNGQIKKQMFHIAPFLPYFQTENIQLAISGVNILPFFCDKYQQKYFPFEEDFEVIGKIKNNKNKLEK